MIAVQNNNGYRGLYVSAEFRPIDTPATTVAAAYSGATVSNDGYHINDEGWLPPTGSVDGPIREWLRYSLTTSTAGNDASGNPVGQGHIVIFSAPNVLNHSEQDDFASSFPGERYFMLPAWGRCIDLSMTIYTPLNMFDRRSVPKTSLVNRSFSEGWPISTVRIKYGQQDFGGGVPWFYENNDDDVVYFSLDEAAVAAGTEAPFPIHSTEFIPGELSF